MRRVTLATALIAASLIGGTVAANAEEFGFSVGVGDHDAYWRDTTGGVLTTLTRLGAEPSSRIG